MKKQPPKTGHPTAVVLPRVAGRISFCYVDAARIRRNEFGVVARVHTKERGTEEIELPVATFAALMIGPGTSITQPALSLTTQSGCAVVCVGQGAGGATAVALPHGQSSKWLELQVTQWADHKQRQKTAQRLYKKRFAIDPGPVTIATLRGLEGARVKKAYRDLARQHNISFKRSYSRQDWDESDPVNKALSTANHVLYGIVQSAMAALGVHPGLGFIHTGTDRAFVFDIADLYKLTVCAPAAFACHDSLEPEREVRGRLRQNLKLLKLLPRIIPDIQEILDPSSKPQRTLVDPILLWDPTRGALPGGTNYDEEPW